MKDLTAIHVRLPNEQYEWLREHCYKTRKPQAEVVRDALSLYRDFREVESREDGMPKVSRVQDEETGESE